MQSIKVYLNDPKQLLLGLVKRFGFLFSDKVYLEIRYRLEMGRKLDLKHPMRYTEKLQWLKLYNRKADYSKMVDKFAVKEYVSKIIGKSHIIPTLGVWNYPKDINWDDLPDQFVLKTTHGGGGSGVIICSDKSKLDKKKAIHELEKSMNCNIYRTSREWPYKNVPKRVIAEKYMSDGDGQLRDYKFYCFNGVPKVVLAASNRYTTHNFDYFDMDFKHLPIVSLFGEPLGEQFKRPIYFDEMREIASLLSKGLPHVRVDLYCTADNVYFGELTFFDSSGFDNMSSDDIDLEWGSWITLPTIGD